MQRQKQADSSYATSPAVHLPACSQQAHAVFLMLVCVHPAPLTSCCLSPPFLDPPQDMHDFHEKLPK